MKIFKFTASLVMRKDLDYLPMVTALTARNTFARIVSQHTK
jgi:hypothetical protein